MRKQVSVAINNICVGLLFLAFTSCQSTVESEAGKRELQLKPDSLPALVNEVFEDEPDLNDQDSIIIIDPDNTLRRIFTSFIKFQESTDSKENLDSMRQSIKLVGQDSNWISPATLRLLLDIWMYYDVTDFAKRRYVEERLSERPFLSIKAIDQRINKKNEWEDTARAPLSELEHLREKLIVLTNE